VTSYSHHRGEAQTSCANSLWRRTFGCDYHRSAKKYYTFSLKSRWDIIT